MTVGAKTAVSEGFSFFSFIAPGGGSIIADCVPNAPGLTRTKSASDAAAASDATAAVFAQDHGRASARVVRGTTFEAAAVALTSSTLCAAARARKEASSAAPR